MSYLELDRLTLRWSPTTGVFDLSLGLARGKILALLGPSGSGKTTTLRLLGGFEAPDAGRIVVEGEDVTGLPPERRRFGMVFQHYALFPHLDVGENVAFGLREQGMAPPEIEGRVAEALELVDLAGFLRRRVTELSGGQQQRVALARALAPRPRVLLLDEPLSNLDPTLRERTRGELRRLIHRVGITTVIVTHEQEEAFDLGDEVAVLRNGRLEQAGAPPVLYQQPATAFVAGFVGRASVVRVELPGGRVGADIPVSLGGVTWRLAATVGGDPVGRARLYIRPEAVSLAEPGPTMLRGRVTDRRFTGAQAFYLVETSAGVIEVAGPPDGPDEGAAVGVSPSGRGFHLFPDDGS
jgi:putative spermidine/putrescine transport system ATP-binding protein